MANYNVFIFRSTLFGLPLVLVLLLLLISLIGTLTRLFLLSGAHLSFQVTVALLLYVGIILAVVHLVAD